MGHSFLTTPLTEWWDSLLCSKNNSLESHTYNIRNKVNTTSRCEALKEVYVFELCFILKYCFTKHFHIKNSETRSTRPIDAKLWKKLCLWIMFHIKISHYQHLHIKDPKIFQIFLNVLSITYLLSQTPENANAENNLYVIKKVLLYIFLLY